MKKCLIFIEKEKLNNAGGPLGYNYNLKMGLDEINDDSIQIDFLENHINNNSLTSRFKKINNKFVFSTLKGIRDLSYYLKLFSPFGHNSSININNYDFIHFHSTFDLFNIRKALKKYKGKILLTSHSPILPSVEIGQGVEKWIRVLFFWLFLFERKIDKYSFKNANYIVSPCEEATYSYSKYWKGYKKNTESKTKYLVTGCVSIEQSYEENTIRSKYSMDKGKFNIVFLGRHNKLKGYDILKSYGELLKKDDNIRFIIGGNKGKIKPPILNNWIELGFTKDALAIMKYANVYVSCNSDTYFDLATIQALSVGTPVITKMNGGNLYFKNNNFPGVYLFNNFKEFNSIITYLRNLDSNEYSILSENITSSFKKTFSEKVFARNYIELLKNL